MGCTSPVPRPRLGCASRSARSTRSSPTPVDPGITQHLAPNLHGFRFHPAPARACLGPSLIQSPFGDGEQFGRGPEVQRGQPGQDAGNYKIYDTIGEVPVGDWAEASQEGSHGFMDPNLLRAVENGFGGEPASFMCCCTRGTAPYYQWSNVHRQEHLPAGSPGFSSCVEGPRDWRRRRIADDADPHRTVWCFPSNSSGDRPAFRGCY
jgi:hypothetical protein